MKGLFNSTSSPPSPSKMDDPAQLSAFLKYILLQGHAYTAEQRRQATKTLIAWFREHVSTSSSNPEYLNAVTALKTLGRSPDGTEELATEQGINLLLNLAQFSPANKEDGFMRDPLSPPASEAIRCLANVCLLHESGRIRLAGVHGLAETLIRVGEQATDQMTRFLAARLLFLITISGVETSIIHLVEDLQISKQLTARLLDNLEELATLSTSTSSASARDGTMVNIVNPNDAVLKMKIDILIEYLKVAFNVSLFYPRAVKERQEKTKKQKSTLESSAMSKSTSSSSTASSSSSSSSKSKSSRSSSPIEGINGRLSPKNTFDNTTSRIGVSHDVARTKSSSSSSTTSNGRSKSPSNLPKKATEIYKGATEKARGYFSRKGKETENVSVKEMYAEDADVLKSWGFEDVVSALVQLALCLPFASGPDYGPFGVFKHIINALLNYNFTSYPNTIYAPLSPYLSQPIATLPNTSPTKSEPSLPPFIARLLTLLDGCATFYIPGKEGPDDDAAREAALKCPGILDESLQVLILLLTKCVVEDITGEVKKGIKQCLIADDIDRSIGLEKRKDLTGRLIRLLNSTYLSGSGEAAGKFLFAICDQDPSALVAAIGYGNASGFLQSMNMLIPPGATSGGNGNDSPESSPTSSPPSSSSRPINPITGAYDPVSPTNEPKMTDEEKEREAEKLFVLFDRMNRNPAMSVVNPVKQAQENGQLTTSAEEEELERKKLDQEDEEDEKQALEEMKRYKERKNKYMQ